MSKTRRRKSSKTPRDYGFLDYVMRFYGATVRTRYDSKWEDIVDKNCEQYKKFCDRIYHRDTRPGYGWNANVPKSYRKCVVAQCRAKDKSETRKILKKGLYDEYNFNPWKSDAGYDYW